MDKDQGLENSGPGRLAQTLLHCPEDLGDSGLSRMRRDENMLYVFRLRSGELRRSRIRHGHASTRYDTQFSSPTLDLVPPLTDFSKVLAIDRGVLDVGCMKGRGT